MIWQELKLEFKLKNKNYFRNGFLMAFSILNLSCSVVGIRSEETPKYEVLLQDETNEIRSYSSYVIAKTTVQGEYKDSLGQGFRILASYIFGKNEKKTEISMTAPVAQSKPSSQKISMTAPVAQNKTEAGWEMSFMMPSQYKMSDLPKPLDPRISFEEVSPKLMAVIQFTGWRDEKSNQRKAEELKRWLSKRPEYQILSGPVFAGYDPPWTIPFFRRNEVMFELSQKAD